jgi:hypothetical protein
VKELEGLRYNEPPARFLEMAKRLSSPEPVYREKHISFEMKTKIDSLGSLVRQIKHYRSYVQGDFCVVHHDESIADFLKTQKILFLKCDVHVDDVPSQGFLPL